VTGSYFRMVEAGKGPGGPDSDYLTNTNSTCSSDQTYTLFVPGTNGGLVTGGYQPAPSPAFDSGGNSLADQIIQPAKFFGVNFSVSTSATDPQTSQSVPVPSVAVDGSGSLSGNLEAWSAEWNSEYFNQGSPKPGGGTPGFTAGPTGSYSSATKAYSLSWTSQIVGGPFNSFTGQWHLVGTFTASSGPTTTTTTPTGSTTPTTAASGGGSPGGTGSTAAGGSTGSSSSGSGSSSTLPFTGEPIPLWFPLVLIALGGALTIPTRRMRRADREDAP